MIVAKKPRFFILRMMQWQWKASLSFVLFALLAWGIDYLKLLEIQIPALIFGVLGGVLGIFISFRTNAAYNRWWEGRKLWGRMINTSRHWGQQISVYISEPALQRELIQRHIAYVHTLRVLLRQEALAQDTAVQQYLNPEEKQGINAQSNATHYLLKRQLKAVHHAAQTEKITGLELQSLDESLRHLLDIQGGCERIKKTPMPPAYGLLGTRLTMIFGLILPLGLVHEMGWKIIPLNLVLCLSFTLINELGRVMEDPFTLYYNGLPLSQISKMIEVNLLQCLDQDDPLPEIPQPTKMGILM